MVTATAITNRIADCKIELKKLEIEKYDLMDAGEKTRDVNRKVANVEIRKRDHEKVLAYIQAQINKVMNALDNLKDESNFMRDKMFSE